MSAKEVFILGSAAASAALVGASPIERLLRTRRPQLHARRVRYQGIYEINSTIVRLH